MYKRSPHYGRFCEFLYLTGMRYGEAASLYRSDIHKQDDDKVVATVNSTLVNGQKQPSPKTSSSRRDVTLTKRAQLIVKQELVDHPFKSNFIFESKQGHPLGNVVLNYWLRQAKSELKIDKTLSLHTFRHTHISKLAELGVPLYLIQNRVGHKDAETTKEIYLHVTKKAEQKLDSKLNLL
ncbi:site-specific integrase [Limosilactobacillus vaginalis]|uniref:Site-specific integrase n=2 Tax=Limosilactobacillus vaginalis TaxID=1633 RepID=A0AAW5WVP6_9LACO|nr:site-specific integrase [Limosilactobacillus vaginalis]